MCTFFKRKGAIAWILSKDEGIIALTGARRVYQLQDLMKSLDVRLNESDVKRIEAAIPENEIAGGSFPDMKFKNGIMVH